MKWIEGKGYSDALMKTYKNVFMQFSIWSCTKGSVKYIAIPFYASYVIIFTVIPLMPIIGTLSEASYFKEAGGYVQEETEQIEAYLEPLENSIPPSEKDMLKLAREQRYM